MTTPEQQQHPPSTPIPRTSSLSGSAANKKAARERVRATRACDRCKAKKARCTGNSPCALCVRLGHECLYNASYRRGKTPHIPSASHDSLPVNLPTPRAEHPTNVLPETRPLSMQNVDFTPSSPEPQASASDQDQTDLQGGYIGPASGVSFLTRAKKRLREDASSVTTGDSSVFAFGDTPLPQHDSSFLVLPPKSEAFALIARYFDVTSPTHRYLHKPTVEHWCDELYEKQMRYHLPSGERERNAVVLMVLAFATLTSGPGSKDVSDKSFMFYAASEQQLARETGETRLTSVVSRLLQCNYLASKSRINHAWTLFGTTARLALAVGLHRKQRHYTAGGVNFIEAECKKRTFWCAYSLDRYLSAALGRPKAFHDDDIDQDLPECVDDENILPHKIITDVSRTQSVMQAAICHIKLTRILSGILKEQYGINRMTTSSHALVSAKYDAALQSWREEASPFVTRTWQDILFMAAPFSRQCEVLIHVHSHAVILLHRPLLLCDIKTEEDRRAVQNSAAACIGAGIRILQTYTDSCNSKRMHGTFWLMQYYVFCAIAVLYVCIIRKLSSPDSWSTHMAMADTCQHLLSQHALQASFARRYGIFLGELRSEAERKVRIRISGGLSRGEFAGTVDDGVGEEMVHALLEQQQHQQDVFGSMDLTSMDHASASSLFEDLTNWEELDSFVMAGVNFDFDAGFTSTSTNEYAANLGFGGR